MVSVFTSSGLPSRFVHLIHIVASSRRADHRQTEYVSAVNYLMRVAIDLNSRHIHHAAPRRLTT